MAKVDKITVRNFTSYLNTRVNSAPVGDSDNPAKGFLNSLGITESLGTLTRNDRVPSWFREYVSAARKRRTPRISVAAAREVLASL